MNEIKVDLISVETFESLGFGKIVDVSNVKPDALADRFNWWNKLAVVKYHETSLGLVEARPSGGIVNSDFEYHGNTSEMLIPTTSDVYLFIGKGKSNSNRELDYDSVKAFKLKAGQAAVLKPYIWHCAPIAGGNKVTRVFVLFENNTPADDFYSFDTKENSIIYKI